MSHFATLKAGNISQYLQDGCTILHYEIKIPHVALLRQKHDETSK